MTLPSLRMVLRRSEHHADFREYHRGEGTEAEFWAVRLLGIERTICQGRVGTEGVREEKTFARGDQAWRATEREIAKRLGEGYERVLPPAEVPARVLRTPEPPFDVAARVPQLKEHRRTAVRLHPVPHENPPVDSSHMGGRFLWPREEPWPTSHNKQSPTVMHRKRTHNANLVAVLQLLREDVPEFPFPEGKDVFQLLWNPRDHKPPLWGVDPLVVWRCREDVGEVLEEAPPPEMPDQFVLPRPCTLHPERVVEYPLWVDEELEAALREELGDELYERDYQYSLSLAPGCKVLGYPYYHVTDPPCEPLRCRSCGDVLEHVLTIDSDEGQGRWEAEVVEGPPVEGLDDNPTRLMINRSGSLFGYCCLRCADRPFEWLSQ